MLVPLLLELHTVVIVIIIIDIDTQRVRLSHSLFLVGAQASIPEPK